MQGQNLNLRHLKAFAEVCRSGGISAATGSVHLSQPAITQAIARLETDFGLQLFARSSKGMVPTQAAEILYERTLRALDLLRAAAQKTRKGSGFADQLTSTQLRALIAVAGHGNFSVAARSVGVSQPSLYRTARDLEALSEQLLFVKRPKGIELTPAAELLVRAARLAFAEMDHAIDDIGQLQGVERGVLRIGSLPLARGTILPRALNQLTSLRPRLQISVSDSSYDEMLHALRHGEIDLMLGALRWPAPAPDVVQETLFTDRLGVFCGPSHPLRNSRPSKADLAAYPWVVARKGTPTRAHFDAFFGGQHGAVIESNAMLLVRGLLQDSDRLTMISANQVSEELHSRSLYRLPIDLGDSPREIGMTWRADWRPTQAQKTLISILRELAPEFSED